MSHGALFRLFAKKKETFRLFFFSQIRLLRVPMCSPLAVRIRHGYLSYDEERETVRIPNEEIRMEYADSVHNITHVKTIQRVKRSVQLMKDTFDMNAEAAAKELQKVHTEECNPLHYNNEQSLRGTIKLAYFAYRDQYIQLEELAGGAGYADIVYLPKKNSEYPALVIELKAPLSIMPWVRLHKLIRINIREF